MDRLERVYSPEETFTAIMDARAARMWTALPGTIQSFNRSLDTCTVQLGINGRVKQTDGTYLSIQMPVIADVPVLWIGGGGVTFVFDVSKGDECLVHFSARCIDAWWTQGFLAGSTGTGADGRSVNSANDPPEFRMHNLSDGFALVGVRSKPRALTIDPGVARIRTDDDSGYVEFNPTAKTLKMVWSGGLTMNGVTVDSSGNIVTTGNISGATVTGSTQVVAGSGGSAVHLTTHTHPGNGQPPTPGT